MQARPTKSHLSRPLRLSPSAAAALIAAVCAAVSVQATERAARAESQRKPNVVLIFTDDQGTVDMNVYGADDLQTPHMDSIARRGVRFTQFYAASSVCSPSRAGLLTGRFPLRAGVPGNVSSTEGHAGMSADQATIADTLHAAGYATAHIGKWHLGYTPDTMPNAQGFDFSFGHMGGCIDNWSHFFYWQGPNRHDLHRDGQRIYRDGQYFPALMVEEAAAFMEQHREQPFFVYFALNTPHYPYQGHTHWLEHYRDLDYPRNLYAAFLSTQDEYIGQLLAKIDELGLGEQTIVIFQSDHGHSTEERAHHGGGSAGPYRGAKFSFFEGGIRVPALISWPGTLPANETRDQVAHSCDWLPTIAELCEVPLSEPDIDGTSIVQVIRSADAPSPDRVLHWQTGRGPNASWAVRDGDWKLLGNPRDPSNKAPLTDADHLFLVNLAQDATEMKNLAKQHPDVVERLEKLHKAWLAESE
jgi:arylsulfatase A